MNKNLVTIVALSVDTRHAVLYLANGSTMNIEQGDARLPIIVATAKTALEAHQAVVVDVTPVVVQRTEFSDAEKGTKGVIRFFKVAKSFLADLANIGIPKETLGSGDGVHIGPLKVGIFPEDGTKEKSEEQQHSADIGTAHYYTAEELAEFNKTPVVADAVPAPDEGTVDTGIGIFLESQNKPKPFTNDQKLEAAQSRMQQLVGHSKGTQDPEFHTTLNEDTETIVAVHERTGAIIPDAHKLARQLRSAQKLQDYAGFEKFIARLANIIDQRGHSVEDLMKFIENGDLPIADDGCIVIYKRLNSRDDHFVDVHSGGIRQKVGSYVFLKPELVDPDRRKDCSNGLHVASLTYLNSFSGNATVIAKVRPEDVFAVPEYAHNKMRVCGYHILAVLPYNLQTLVNSGGSISSSPDGAILLNSVLRGNHIGITQHVEVGGNLGTNVTYTDVKVDSADKLKIVKVVVALGTAETLDMKASLEPELPVADRVKATDLISAPAEKVVTPKLTQADKAKELYLRFQRADNLTMELLAAQELLDFKKAAKKSWVALGLPESTGTVIEDAIGKTKPEPVKEVVVPVVIPVTEKPVKVEKPAKVAAKHTLGKPQKQAIKIMKLGETSNSAIAKATGLNKDQVYRLRKKFSL